MSLETTYSTGKVSSGSLGSHFLLGIISLRSDAFQGLQGYVSLIGQLF